MAKMTSGPGWCLSSDEPPKALSPKSSDSPRPKMRLEKRMGKCVTVVAGLHTYGAERLQQMAREWKTLCGAGGTVKNGAIEIQGDKVKVLQQWFLKKGMK